MKDFSIIAEDGIVLDDLRTLIDKTKELDGNIPVKLHYFQEDGENAKEIAYYDEENKILIYNYL